MEMKQCLNKLSNIRPSLRRCAAVGMYDLYIPHGRLIQLTRARPRTVNDELLGVLSMENRNRFRFSILNFGMDCI